MRRAFWFVAAVVAVAVVLVVIGRHERTSDLAQRNHEIAQIRARVGPDLGRNLTAYRTMPSFTCVLYGTHTVPFGLELCVEPTGRVVEAIDRRDPAHVHIGTLRFDPAAATTRIDPTRLLAVLERRDPKLHTLPLGGDVGPLGFPAPKK